MSLPHNTTPVQVWADIDNDIVWLVKYLNRMPGIRTWSSCQGTIGEGGPAPYPPYVMVTWDNYEVLKELLRDFDVTLRGPYFGDVHPRADGPISIKAWRATMELVA